MKAMAVTDVYRGEQRDSSTGTILARSSQWSTCHADRNRIPAVCPRPVRLLLPRRRDLYRACSRRCGITIAATSNGSWSCASSHPRLIPPSVDNTCRCHRELDRNSARHPVAIRLAVTAESMDHAVRPHGRFGGSMEARQTIAGVLILYALTLLLLSQVLPVRHTALPPVHAAAMD